jgi:hypothetical protein
MTNNTKIEENKSGAPLDIIVESEEIYASVSISKEDPFDFYYRIVGWSIFFGAALIIGLYLLNSFDRYSDLFLIDVYYYSLIIEAIIFIYLGSRITPPNLPFARGGASNAHGSFSDSRGNAGKIGVVVGVILGIILAIFKLFWYYKVWTFFNLITEPIITGIMGFLICGAIGWIRGRRRSMN